MRHTYRLANVIPIAHGFPTQSVITVKFRRISSDGDRNIEIKLLQGNERGQANI